MCKEANKLAQLRRSGTNLARAKLHNHSVVLDVIRTSGAISRSKLAKITSLSRQTIQNIVSELEHSNVITLSASKVTGRGHPGMDIRINPECAFSAGFHIDNGEIRGVVCNLEGKVIWTHRIIPEGESGDSVTAGIQNALLDFRQQHPMPASRLVGIGLAAPGPFVSSDSTEEITNYTGFGLSTTLRNLNEMFNMPFILDNDAAAAATGEFYYGLGRGVSNFVFLQFGLGIGAGLVIDGKIHRGTALNAGEIGHIIVEPDGLPCPCGNNGCLEQYLSFGAFCRHFNFIPTTENFDREFASFMSEKQHAASEWFEQAGQRFKLLLNIIEMTFDPELIVIGGTAPKQIMEQILQSAQPLHRSLRKHNGSEMRVCMGTAGPDTVALGAAATSLEKHFAPSVSQLLL